MSKKSFEISWESLRLEHGTMGRGRDELWTLAVFQIPLTSQITDSFNESEQRIRYNSSARRQNWWKGLFLAPQVWVLGEYLSLSCDSRCSVRLITSCFEALEAVLFEITSASPPDGTACPAPRVITTLMSTLAKLASRSHDLIPRWGLDSLHTSYVPQHTLSCRGRKKQSTNTLFMYFGTFSGFYNLLEYFFFWQLFLFAPYI